MVKELSTQAQSLLTRKIITRSFNVYINDVINNDVISYSQDFSSEFGIAILSVTLNNDAGIYSKDGASEINIGDTVKLKERFYGTGADEFTNFTGYVRQREISHSKGANAITLSCLDLLCKLEDTEISAKFEATKVQVTNEILTPSYLAAPNENMAIIFNFAHEALVSQPPITIVIKDLRTNLEYPQFDGFEINYETGQLILGSAINARYNYSVLIKLYSFYPVGLNVEDIIEDILIEPDGYDNYLFEEASAQAVIDNHLTETFLNIEGKSVDTLIPNYITQTKTIRTLLDGGCTAGDTSITVIDTTGFPDSGTGDVNGDVFTWGHKTATTLTDIPSSGSNALKTHPDGAYVQYDYSCAPGQCWYSTYSNIITSLIPANFTVPGSTIDYINLHSGFIILKTAIATTSVVTCNVSYSFKTLQATNIEINKIEFTDEKTENRFDAIRKLRENLAPNYLIQTIGTDKIWARYVKQKSTEDYTLQLKTKLELAEDEDIYTHTKFFGKSANPKNVCLNEDVDLLTTGESYSDEVNNHQLTYFGDAGDNRVYITGLPAVAWITTENIQPVVRINGSPIDNKLHEILMQQVKLLVTTRTETRTGCHGISKEQYVKTHTYYYYKIYFPHTNIERNKVIVIYNPSGEIIFTLGPDDPRVNYEEGIWSVPGEEQNSIVETCSTASYFINYSTSKLTIDLANARFLIEKDLIPDISKAIVTADFEYYTVLITMDSAGNMFDGRWDTQTQMIFYAKPPSGYVFAILDLKSAYSIQAIDIIHGFFKPDDRRNFDISNKYSLYYSLDNLSYSPICKEAINFNLAGGASISFERDKLGDSFSARYIKIVINDMTKLDYSTGVWVASFVEIAIYEDVVLIGEAFLTPTTKLNQAYVSGTILNVISTDGFSDSGTAYLTTIEFPYTTTEFTYIAKTITSFTGCSGLIASAKNTRVSQELESNTLIYDDDSLLPKLQDKLFKNKEINEFLDSQTRIEKRAKDYLTEYYKEHSKGTVDLLFSPHIRVGQTVLLKNAMNNIEKRYFVDSLRGTEDSLQLTLAYYPA